MANFVRSVLLLVVGLFLTLPANAQNLLDQARQLREIKAQKVEADIRDLLSNADRLGRAEPAKAGGLLRGALSILDDDDVLTPARREALKQTVRDRMKKFGIEAARVQPENTKVPTRNDDTQRRAEDESIKQGLSTINSLRASGKNSEADARTNDLVRKYPSNATLTLAQGISLRKEALDSKARVNEQKSNSYAQAVRNADGGFTLPKNDYDFPKDWAERVKNRSAGPKMTEKEKKIVKALATPIPADFTKARLAEVIEYLSKTAGVPILVDEQSLREVSATYDSEVTIKANDITLRTVLRKVLADLGLTYIVKDEAIQVISAARAKSEMVVRTYNVGDLITSVDNRWGPWATQAQVTQNVLMLMELIQKTVEPNSWEINNGLGTIAFYPPTMSLIVKQSAEIHFVLGGAFR